MDNKTKQYVSHLKSRILRLENMFEAMNLGLQQEAHSTYNCDQCGAYNPLESGYVCSIPDCCQGLNPEDDDS